MPLAEGEVLDASRFELTIDGVTVPEFTTVSGLMMSISEEQHSHNLTAERLTKKHAGIVHYPSITLTRPLTDDKALWDEFAIHLAADAKHTVKTGSLVLKDQAGDEIVKFTLADVWFSDYYISPCNANYSSVMEETVTMSVGKIEREL